MVAVETKVDDGRVFYFPSPTQLNSLAQERPVLLMTR